MQIIIYIVDTFTKIGITKFWSEDNQILPNVNDTIRITSIGDFVVTEREFGYGYDDEHNYQVLDYIELRVYPKPINKEEK